MSMSSYSRSIPLTVIKKIKNRTLISSIRSSLVGAPEGRDANSGAEDLGGELRAHSKDVK